MTLQCVVSKLIILRDLLYIALVILKFTYNLINIDLILALDPGLA